MLKTFSKLRYDLELKVNKPDRATRCVIGGGVTHRHETNPRTDRLTGPLVISHLEINSSEEKGHGMSQRQHTKVTHLSSFKLFVIIDVSAHLLLVRIEGLFDR